MPEGPEVRIIAEQLNALLKGARLLSIEVEDGLDPERYQGMTGVPADSAIIINYVKSRGKFIYVELQLGSKFRYIASHMATSGTWSTQRTPYTRVTLHYKAASKPQSEKASESESERAASQRGATNEPKASESESERDAKQRGATNEPKASEIYFNDIRKMGYLHLVNTAELRAHLERLGPDIFNPSSFTKAAFLQLCDDRAQRGNPDIAELLADQEFICGVGNYLRADILYCAAIAPQRRLRELSTAQLERLFDCIVKISQTSYEAGGTTISDYQDVRGAEGRYHPLVYGRTQDDQGNPVEQWKKGGRTIYWVPAVQH